MKAYTQTPLFRFLATRGITYADLARITGLNIRTIYNVACGNNCSSGSRSKIESALGVQIWTGDGPVATASISPALQQACSAPSTDNSTAMTRG